MWPHAVSKHETHSYHNYKLTHYYVQELLTWRVVSDVVDLKLVCSASINLSPYSGSPHIAYYCRLAQKEPSTILVAFITDGYI